VQQADAVARLLRLNEEATDDESARGVVEPLAQPLLFARFKNFFNNLKYRHLHIFLCEAF
jgi:hypothetical protein